MQILLGVHETIIRINSQSIKIDYIQHYISTHFLQRTIKNNLIEIPSSTEDSYYRVFLLKWLYTLYTKKTKQLSPELKESLVKRAHKKIKIQLKEQIIHRLVYTVQDADTISLQIIPANNHIAYTVKTFLNTKLTILPTSMTISFEDEESKALLKKFIYSHEYIDIPHEHIFNKQKMQNFFTPEVPKEKSVTDFDKACLLFGIAQDFNEKILKKRYKTLAKQFHPDKAETKDNYTINLYTEKFQHILNAYEVLLQKVS